jgi:hypothetical protein
MRRALRIAALAAGATLLGVVAVAWAQEAPPRDAPPPGTGEVPRAASAAGTVYIPGVGFRFVTPPGARVYGWYYGPRVYGWYDDRESRRYQHGYHARKVACGWRDEWFGGRCARRWR